MFREIIHEQQDTHLVAVTIFTYLYFLVFVCLLFLVELFRVREACKPTGPSISKVIEKIRKLQLCTSFFLI